MDYMARLSGKSQEELIDELNGVIFLDPVHGEWQTADEYLSGDVRQKLREAEAAAEDSPGYLPNVEALRQAQPKDLDASEIEVRLGERGSIKRISSNSCSSCWSQLSMCAGA